MIFSMSEGESSSNSPRNAMPALLIRMSTLPHASSADWTTAPAELRSATLLVSAIASPPASTISLTTASASAGTVPRPSGPSLVSLTTTFAPRAASSIA